MEQDDFRWDCEKTCWIRKDSAEFRSLYDHVSGRLERGEGVYWSEIVVAAAKGNETRTVTDRRGKTFKASNRVHEMAMAMLGTGMAVELRLR